MSIIQKRLEYEEAAREQAAMTVEEVVGTAEVERRRLEEEARLVANEKVADEARLAAEVAAPVRKPRPPADSARARLRAKVR